MSNGPFRRKAPPVRRIWAAGSGGRGYSGTEELVQWERVSVQDEDAFIIEGQFGGLPGDMGGVDGFGLLLLRLGEQGGHTDRLHGFDVVGWLGRGRDVDDAFPHAVEVQKELDFLRAGEGSGDFHEALAGRAEERVLPQMRMIRLRQRGRSARALSARGAGNAMILVFAARVLFLTLRDSILEVLFMINRAALQQKTSCLRSPENPLTGAPAARGKVVRSANP